MESTLKMDELRMEPKMRKRFLEIKDQDGMEKDMQGRDAPESKAKRLNALKQTIKTGLRREKSKLYIKNMVSIRCKMLVGAVMENLGLEYLSVDLGEVAIAEPLSENMHQQLKSTLLKYGLELMDDIKNIIVEKIKMIIIEMIHYEDELPKVKFSHYLSNKLNYDYTYLSNLFSEVKGTTIEHFIIVHKIERVKELIMYEELNLSEIAWRLHYSSVSHLSNQFRKITGLTPTHFKNMKSKRRSAIENL